MQNLSRSDVTNVIKSRLKIHPYYICQNDVIMNFNVNVNIEFNAYVFIVFFFTQKNFEQISI